MTIDPGRLRARLLEARERLDAACAVSGRPPGSVELVLAGKYVPAGDAPALVRAGVRVVGENRLQDLQAKRSVVGEGLEFDFIGHLQRRKVRAVLGAVRLLHSLDSDDLAGEIARRVEGSVRLLVEVNVADEDGKYGIRPRDLVGFVDRVSAHEAIVVGGLMAMPPLAADPEAGRRWFARTRELAGDLATRFAGRHDLTDLSMGTSQDFAVAAEEGATMVRVGRGLIDDGRAG